MKRRKPLRASELAALAEPGRYNVAPNLFLRVSLTAAGNISRKWIFLYQLDGRTRELGFGSITDVNPTEARARAETWRVMIRKGEDPQQEETRTDHQPKTLRECMLEFVESKQRDWRPGRSAGYGYAAKFPREFALLGELNDMPVHEINTEAVRQAIEPIWAKFKSAHSILAKVERVLDVAKVRGFRSGDNPARWYGHMEVLLPKRPTTTNYAAMPYPEVPRFIARLHDESFQCVDRKDRYRKREAGLSVRRYAPVTAICVEFLILTAARQREASDAVWSEVDFETALWMIPEARMKQGRGHVVPLSRQALALLRGQQELQISAEFVFPTQMAGRAKPIVGSTLLQVLRTLGIGPEQATIHGFRSAFKDWAANETDFPDELSEEALSHSVGSLTRRAYRREVALDRRRQLMQAWADYVAPAR